MIHRTIPQNGRLIAFEGLDGSGKSTQLRLAAQALTDLDYPVVVTREPTDGPFGRQIRQLFADRSAVTAEQELELFLADRQEHVEQVIAPALAAGKVVLTDRYYLSTAAYQGARGQDVAMILRRNEAFAPPPDMVIYLEIPVAQGLLRITAGRGEVPNEFEQETNLRRVQTVFAQISRPFLYRLDGNRPVSVVHQEVMERILKMCGQS